MTRGGKTSSRVALYSSNRTDVFVDVTQGANVSSMYLQGTIE